MADLATVGDLEDRLGRGLTTTEAARAPALLAAASALIRGYTRQTFDAVTGDVAVLRPVGDTLRLPQRPVTAVTSVVAVGGSAVGGSDALPDITLTAWVFDGVDTIRLSQPGIVLNHPEEFLDGGYPDTYRVTYDHGYTEIPPLVVEVCCGMVLRTLTAPAVAGGVTAETIGAYSYRLDSPGEGVAVRLTGADRDTLTDAGFRRRAGTIALRVG